MTDAPIPQTGGDRADGPAAVRPDLRTEPPRKGPDGLRIRRPAVRRGARGMTLLELVLASMVLVVATTMMLRTMASLSGQRAINRENALASDAVRNLIEAMRGEDFGEVFALYNADASDDPVQPEPIPGHRFAVPGLEPLPTSPDGLVGELLFPTVDVAALGAEPDLELREDVVDAVLGTPRDLNGDSIIDGVDHASDYYLLPFAIRLRWQGRHGPREYLTTSMLCDLTP